MACSNGSVSDTVYVVQDKSMGDDECLQYAVPGLSSSLVSGNMGHLFFMKSRSPNSLFMELYNEKVLLPFFDTVRFIKHLSSTLSGDDSDVHNIQIVFFLDGEDKLLDVYRSDAVAGGKFEKVTIVKLPPSFTSKTRPLDVENNHDSKKKTIGKIKEVHVHEDLIWLIFVRDA